MLQRFLIGIRSIKILDRTERSVGTESLRSSYSSYSLSIDISDVADFFGRIRCQKWAGPGNLLFL